MTTLIALLRAINVTGTGALRMADLRALCTRLGFGDVRTYIQSGNVVFSTAEPTPTAKAALEAALLRKVGRPTRAVLRTADELARVVAANPYPEAPPDRLLILFLDAPPARADAARLKRWPVPAGERMTLVRRELFIHFPDGQGRSRLKVPFADVGTGRNLNTVRALLAMARGEP